MQTLTTTLTILVIVGAQPFQRHRGLMPRGSQRSTRRIDQVGEPPSTACDHDEQQPPGVRSASKAEISPLTGLTKSKNLNLLRSSGHHPPSTNNKIWLRSLAYKALPFLSTRLKTLASLPGPSIEPTPPNTGGSKLKTPEGQF